MVLGGTGLTGPHVVADLVHAGSEVAVVHRGVHERPLPDAVQHIHVTETDTIGVERRHVDQFQPDVIIHMVAIVADHLNAVLEAASGLVSRVVVVSSIDVYRAYGRLHRTEPGDPDTTPLSEDAALRTRYGPEGAAHEKLDVERALMESDVGATVVRYPAVYGPGDRRRMTHYVKPMIDQRSCILLDQAMSGWRFSRGFSRNVGRAVALAAMSPVAGGEIYNVADPFAFSEREWVEEIAARVGWSGTIVEAMSGHLPAALRQDLDFRQDWVVDTSKLRRQLGYREPIPMDEAITLAVEWELAHPPHDWSVDYDSEDHVLARLRKGAAVLRRKSNFGEATAGE